MKEHASTFCIRDQLLTGLDPEYNVVDVGVVMEVLCNLERISFSKEALEISRLGKIVNDLRKKTHDRKLATRAKDLVKKWRQDLLPIQKYNTLTSFEAIDYNGVQKRKRPKDGLYADERSAKIPRYGNGIHRSDEPASDSDSNTRSCSTPTNGTIDTSPKNSCKSNGNTISKYSNKLPPHFFTQRGECISQPCSPIESHNAFTTSSNPCSPSLRNVHRLKMLQSYHLNSIEIENGNSCNSMSPLKHVDPLSCSGYTKDKAGNDRISSKINEVKIDKITHVLVNEGTKFDSNVQQIASKTIMNSPKLSNRTNKQKDYGLMLNTHTSPDFVLSGNNIEESLRTMPSSPIKLRPRRKTVDQDEILKQHIKTASRVGNTGKVRTTEELVKELTMARLASKGLTEMQVQQVIDTTDLLSLQVCKETDEFNEVTENPVNSTKLSPEIDARNNHSTEPELLLESSNIKKESVEEVLSRLPPINTSEILSEVLEEIKNEQFKEEANIVQMEATSSSSQFECITYDAIARINNQNIECLNGNFAYNNEFKEWHEIHSRYSDGGNLIHILPYTVID